MPNWTYNRLHASPKVISAILNDKGEVDFNTIVPEPRVLDLVENLQGNYKPYLRLLHKELGDPLTDYYKDHSTNVINIIKDAVATFPLSILKEIQHLYEHTGVSNWYDWHCKYWGCKWNASNDFGSYDGTESEVEFETPWCPPEAFIAKLFEKFPDEDILWHSDEESCAFSVNFTNSHGSVIEEDVEPEYYLPWCPDKSQVEDDLMSAKTVEDVRQYVLNDIDPMYRDIITDDKDKFEVRIIPKDEDYPSYTITFENNKLEVEEDD